MVHVILYQMVHGDNPMMLPHRILGCPHVSGVVVGALRAQEITLPGVGEPCTPST